MKRHHLIFIAIFLAVLLINCIGSEGQMPEEETENKTEKKQGERQPLIELIRLAAEKVLLAQLLHSAVEKVLLTQMELKELKPCMFTIATSNSLPVDFEKLMDMGKLAELPQNIAQMMGKHTNAANDSASEKWFPAASCAKIAMVDQYFVNSTGKLEDETRTAVTPKYGDSRIDDVQCGFDAIVVDYRGWNPQAHVVGPFITDENPHSFRNISGFIRSQTRLQRNMYCVNQFALEVQKAVKENMTKLGMLSAQNKRPSIKYAIAGVWLNKDTAELMKQYAANRAAWFDLVEELGELEMKNMTKDPIYEKVYNRIYAKRESLADQFLKMVEQDNNFGQGNILMGMDGKGSSMAMQGIFMMDGDDKNGYIFHVNANDNYSDCENKWSW